MRFAVANPVNPTPIWFALCTSGSLECQAYFDPAIRRGFFLRPSAGTLIAALFFPELKTACLSMSDKLKIMLVHALQRPPELLLPEVDCSDCELVAVANADDDLLVLVNRYQPDVVIVDMEAPNRDTLENLRCVQAHTPRPMVMFSQDDDSESIRRAVQAGVSAYVVDGMQSKRVRPILDAAIARFEQYRALETELDKTKTQLADRKLIDRAKGLIMRQRGIDETSAYQLLRKAAMDRNLRIAEVAENIVSAADILGGG